MLSCVLVDIVLVSSEQLVEVDQEQVFEDEDQERPRGRWMTAPQ
jgi:hypothetical protein